MKKPSTDHKDKDKKPLLLQAVAHFLDCNGFSKTLKKFRSEAQLEKDGLKDSTLDLEEIYYKYLEMRNHANTGVNNQNEQDTKTDDTSKRDGERNFTVALETGSKKNKKSEQVNSEMSKEPAGHTVCESLIVEPDMKRKERKKKKSKLESGSLPGAIEEKSKEVVSSEGQSVAGSKTKKRSKDNKKKDNPTFDFLDDVKECGLEDKQAAVTTKSEVAANEKKGSKKRKRLASEENDLQPPDNNTAEEMKRRKVAGVQESESSEQSAKVNASQGSDRSASKASQGESGQVSSNDFQKPSSKNLDGQANGNLEISGDKSAFQKTKKQQNGSVEPKTINAFQRVKADDVIFTDDRLKNNSYWAKGGAENGYGAKAQDILGQVRGRDFRHEKTKKKRGSYRGGQIDLESHSIKFNYSDEE